MKFTYLLFSSAVFLTASAFGQAKKNAEVPATPRNNEHFRVFEQAVNSGDAATAISALNYMVAEKAGETPYADTLALLYMQQGQYAQCYYWADRRLKTNPEDNSLLEMRGVCLDKLQQPKEAITVFEKLFAKTKSPYHGYKLMELQYSIKRLAEALATAEQTERLTFKPDYLMTYNVGEQVGRTYLQAGVYNVHALILYDLDKKSEAKTYLEKAVALDTTFLLAKQNLEALNAVAGVNSKGGQVNTTVPPVSPAQKRD